MNEFSTPIRKSGPHHPMEWIDDELRALEMHNRRRKLQLRESPHVNGIVQIDGQPFVDFSSNDYLGISTDPRVIHAVREAVGEHGWGSGASPLVSGYGVLHRRFERELAEFEGTAAAVLFPTGFAANMATIGSLAGAGDLILSDSLNHASIVDGCRLSRATTAIYRHADMDHLESILTEKRSQFRRSLIVTDSLFSMDGDFAPLPEILALARRFECMTMVDEAHATGVWGVNGKGVSEELGVEHDVDVRIGTLSKALGSVGGFVAGPEATIEWIRNKGRAYIFSTAIPNAVAAAGREALKIIRSEPGRREKLKANVSRLGTLLGEIGISAPERRLTQIIPVITGSETAALEKSEQLRRNGLLVPAIRPPAVPNNECRLRISLKSTHSNEQIATLIESLR